MAYSGPPPVYRHTSDMGQISGFGGAYEDSCQDMLEAGVRWLRARPNAALRASGISGVYGILNPESKDAEVLSNVVTNACEDCTAAMHQAVMSRLFWIAKNGWDAYCIELRKREASAS